MGNGFANAASGAAQAKPLDMQYGLQQQQLKLTTQGRNATADWLEAQSNPQLAALAPAVRNGTLSGADALQMALKPGEVVAPGSSVLPNPLSPNYQAPSSSAPPASAPAPAPTIDSMYPGSMPAASALPPPAAPPANMSAAAPAAPWTGTVPPTAAAQLGPLLASASGVAPPVPLAQPNTNQVQPIFTAPTGNPMQMTPQARQDMGRSMGLTGAPLVSFTLTGRMPANEAISWAPMSDDQRKQYGIAPDDPVKYQVSSQGQIKPIGGGSGAANPADDAIATSNANGIVKGNLPPVITGNSKYSPLIKAKLADQGYNLTKATEDYTATQKLVATMNGAQQTRLRQSVQQVSDTLDLAKQLADQWKGSGYPAFNKATLALAAGGAPGFSPEQQSLATRLIAQVSDVTSDLGTVYKGGNSSTDESLKLAATQLSADWSEKTFDDAVDQAKQNIVYRMNSLNLATAGIPNSNYNQMRPAVTAPASGPSVPATPNIQSLLDKYAPAGGQ